MADKKVDATTGEVLDIDLNNVNFESENEPTPLFIQFHCKPTFNYQSIEFDVCLDINDEADLKKLEHAYTKTVEMLVRVSEKAPQKDFKPVQQVEEPATEKQIEVMNTFHIKYPKDVTRKQAQELIKANISAVK